MTLSDPVQRPIRLCGGPKTAVRTQFGALAWRVRRGRVQVALVTGRKSGRWTLPKGWPVDGATPAEAARREAWEEAGLEGRALEICLGLYCHVKRGRGRLPCVVAVFPLEVTRARRTWPERDQRRRKWVTPKRAAKLVATPELKRILREFDPGALPRRHG